MTFFNGYIAGFISAFVVSAITVAVIFLQAQAFSERSLKTSGDLGLFERV